MSDSQHPQNLFKRRAIHSLPINAPAQKTSSFWVEIDGQVTPVGETTANLVAVGPRQVERPVFTPQIVALPTDAAFSLQSEPVSNDKMILMVRPTASIAETGWPSGPIAPQPRRRWLRTVTGGLLLLLFLGGGGLLYNRWKNSDSSMASFGIAAAPTPSPTPKALSSAADSTVIARAIVKPLRNATLEMANSGPVAKIFVKEGDFVRAGQPLLRLDSTLQTIEVAQAKVALLQAQNRLQETKAGSRPAEFAAAQAAVDEAQARMLGADESGVRPSDLAAAQAQLAAAQAQLQDVLNGPQAATLIEARANLQNAKAALQQATSTYDQVRWRNDIAMLPESLQMQKATNDYEAAQARYDLLAQPATLATISNLRSQVEAAKANLARVQTPAKPAEVDAIAAEVRKAQADLQLMQAGARPEAIASAQAEVQAADVAVMRAQAVLSQTVLLAPFSGLIGDIAVEVGEQVAPGKALVQLGDVSGWRIETSDLTELDITKVQEGASAVTAIDALPGETFTGRVAHIKRWGENKVGDIVYTVEILPTQADNRLRWNMTASVTIQTGPNAALSPQTTEGN